MQGSRKYSTGRNRGRSLAEIAEEIDREVAEGICRPIADELRAIEEAQSAVRRGEVASEAEVETVFAR
jgi:hypothetical protein